MSVRSISFLVYQPFELEGVMAVSVRVKTRSSEKIVLPVVGVKTGGSWVGGPELCV